MPDPSSGKPRQSIVDNQFIELESVDSTNNYAMALIHEGLAVDGLTIMARHQLAGRGQRGRQWHGEPGQSLMMSLILRPFPVNLSRQFLFSASVALGLLEVCQSFQADGWAIKWPNDLYWNDRKAAGILIENSIQGRKWNWAVVGIGLNLNQTEFPAGLVHAVSVRQVTGMEYSPKEVAGSLAYSIRKHLDMIKTDADTIIEAYNRNLYKSGKAALLSKQGRSFEARILGVGQTGLLMTDKGNFRSGDLEWIME